MSAEYMLSLIHILGNRKKLDEIDKNKTSQRRLLSSGKLHMFFTHLVARTGLVKALLEQ